MTLQQLERYRTALEDLRQELRGSLDAQDDSIAPVSPDRAIGRLTRQDAMLAQQLALEVRRRNQLRLAQVNGALQRIENGTYGLCIRCEEEISAARLDCRPESTLCIHCASDRPKS